MEEVFGSECSSGCESGWTLYLEQSMYSSHSLQNHNNVDDDALCKKGSFTHKHEEEDDEEEEEDMSMVSDASSGPPHFQEQEECFNNNGGGYFVYTPLPPLIDHNPTNGKRKKIKNESKLHRNVQDFPSFLDDTASSPFFNFSNNNLTVPKASMEDNDIIDYSQGYSTTYFEGKSTYQEHFGFFHPSVSSTQLQQNQWFEGKRWG